MILEMRMTNCSAYKTSTQHAQAYYTQHTIKVHKIANSKAKTRTIDSKQGSTLNKRLSNK